MSKILFVHALSPLHCGTGRALGAVDLPIARDRATGIPFIPGSSLKGALRAKASSESNTKDKVISVFGPETANASDHAGALVVGDANLLLLPVRSVAGTFAYVTSPLLLKRLARDLKEAGLAALAVPSVAAIEACLTGDAQSALLVGNQVLLEDFDFKPTAADGTLVDGLVTLLFDDAVERVFFKKHLCIVHDDVMSFLAEHATQVDARVALEPETKTVKTGALWYEESLPTESILVALCGALPVRQTTAADVFGVVDRLAETAVQLGGKATVGRGRCRLVVKGGGK